MPTGGQRGSPRSVAEAVSWAICHSSDPVSCGLRPSPEMLTLTLCLFCIFQSILPVKGGRSVVVGGSLHLSNGGGLGSTELGHVGRGRGGGGLCHEASPWQVPEGWSCVCSRSAPLGESWDPLRPASAVPGRSQEGPPALGDQAGRGASLQDGSCQRHLPFVPRTSPSSSSDCGRFL